MEKKTIGIFGGMLVVGLGALLWAVGGKLLGFVWFSLAAAAVLLWLRQAFFPSGTVSVLLAVLLTASCTSCSTELKSLPSADGVKNRLCARPSVPMSVFRVRCGVSSTTTGTTSGSEVT